MIRIAVRARYPSSSFDIFDLIVPLTAVHGDLVLPTHISCALHICGRGRYSSSARSLSSFQPQRNLSLSFLGYALFVLLASMTQLRSADLETNPCKWLSLSVPSQNVSSHRLQPWPLWVSSFTRSYLLMNSSPSSVMSYTGFPSTVFVLISSFLERKETYLFSCE